jgi:hypothetical protein
MEKTLLSGRFPISPPCSPFEIVSDFEIRISNFQRDRGCLLATAYRAGLQLSRIQACCEGRWLFEPPGSNDGFDT